MIFSRVVNRRRRPTRSLSLLVLAASLASLYPVEQAVERLGQRRDARGSEMLLVTSGGRLRRWVRGYSGLLAAVYWTRAVQYYGRRRLAHANDYPLLGALLNLTTDLDPHLLIAYRFGSIFLAEKRPEGAGRPQEAIHLLTRGIVANPAYWRLWEDLGFVYYWDLKDYAHAAQAFQIGSERPGALPWMRVMAATIAAKGGDIQTSRVLWLEIARSAGNASIRRSAEEHLAALDAQEALNKLNDWLAVYRQRTGREPRSFEDLVRAGHLPAVPLDPSGVPFVVGPDGGAHLGLQTKIDVRLLP